MQNSAYFEELKKNMSPETLEKYKKIGKDFFSNFDFDSGSMFKVETNVDQVRQIISSLRSGLGVEDLSEDEIKLMEKSFGGEWRTAICKDNIIIEGRTPDNN